MQMMTHTRAPFAAALGALAIAGWAAPSAAQPINTDLGFRWSAPVAPGTRLVLRTLTGNVRVVSGDVDTVQVRAVKSWRTGDPAVVSVRVTRHGPQGRDILVCGVWAGATLSCGETGYAVNNDGRSDTRLDFVVVVPRRMHVSAGTINGTVQIAGVAGDIGGSTVNGSVVVSVAPTANADVVISTVNGTFESDLALAMEGRVRRLGTTRGTLGTGGRTISLASVNGRLRLMEEKPVR